MTDIWTFSDLHQEWPDNAWDPAPHAPASFDVVAVAGDVSTPGVAAVDWLADRFAGVPVVYVLGNHDLYCDAADPFTYLDMHERARERGAARGVHVLVDDAATVAGVRFVGGTLWTDMRHRTHSLGHALNTSRKGMNDYRRIRRKRTGKHHNLRVEETMAMNKATSAFLERALGEPHDGPTVVVTHHAPTPLSLSDPNMDLSWCYVNGRLDTLSRHSPTAWLHGHLHSHSDYLVGATRVVANPRGHVEESGSSGFEPGMVVTV